MQKVLEIFILALSSCSSFDLFRVPHSFSAPPVICKSSTRYSLSTRYSSSNRYGGRGYLLGRWPGSNNPGYPIPSATTATKTALHSIQKYDADDTETTSLTSVLSSPEFEIFSGAATILTAFLYALGTLKLGGSETEMIRYAEEGISAFFFVEYCLRGYAAKFSTSYLMSPLALIDLISFVPNLLNLLMPASPTLASFQLLRLLRILRIQRFLDPEEFFKIEQKLGIEQVDLRQLQFARVFSSLFTLLFISTGLIYECERTVNPAFSDFFTTLYFGLCTLTTVGFGDIVPVTFEGRCVVCASILVGIGVIPLQIGDLAASFLGKDDDTAVKDTKDSQTTNKLKRELKTLRRENKMLQEKLEKLLVAKNR